MRHFDVDEMAGGINKKEDNMDGCATAGQKQRESQVNLEMLKINNAINEVDQAINILADRVADVRLPISTQCAEQNASTPKEPLCPLATRLQEVREHMEEIAKRLQEIHREIEL
ncbi:MAG: hypothetical protein PHY29_02830 [Syntrophales bacterium]|nr:hypothetical protein [Syntrophales bacterium]